MIRLMVFLLGIGFVMACLPRVEAQLTEGLPQLTSSLPLEARIIDETKTLETIRRRDIGEGSGAEKKLENRYTVKLKFTPLEGSLEEIKLRLIPFFKAYNQEQRRFSPKPGKIQIRDNISLQANETKLIELEPEEYKVNEGWDTKTGKLSQTPEYVGVVLEVYHHGILVGTRFNGLPELRKAYETWLEGKFPKPDQPAKKNSGPTLNRDSVQVAPAN